MWAETRIAIAGALFPSILGFRVGEYNCSWLPLRVPVASITMRTPSPSVPAPDTLAPCYEAGITVEAAGPEQSLCCNYG